MAVTLATTADQRLSLGYNGTGSGVCGYNNYTWDAILNPGGMNGNGVAANWTNMCADMVTVMGESMANAIIASGAANQQLSWQPTTALAATYLSSSSFTVAGNQLTAFLPNSKIGRALLLITNGATVFDSVSAATYSSGTGLTTVTTNGAQLVAGSLTVQYGQDPNNDPALPQGKANGVASLNSSSLVMQNPASLGQSNGVAALDANSLIAAAQLAGICFTQYGETVSALGNVSGATTINLQSGGVVTATAVTSATTWTFSNPLATGKMSSFSLILTNGGSQTQNWPASVVWPGGTTPTLTASGVDILVFCTTNGGTTWRGALAQKGYAS
jgi:hypothetical protein